MKALISILFIAFLTSAMLNAQNGQIVVLDSVCTFGDKDTLLTNFTPDLQTDGYAFGVAEWRTVDSLGAIPVIRIFYSALRVFNSNTGEIVKEFPDEVFYKSDIKAKYVATIRVEHYKDGTIKMTKDTIYRSYPDFELLGVNIVPPKL
ncbi:MAG: hypothetical protein LBM93_00395, partial [Oscillospiraceae bacterium]|nr:hypothetical protein [Oscillospiraceae bacterium]